MVEFSSTPIKERLQLPIYEYILWYWFGVSFLIFVPYITIFQIDIRITDFLLIVLSILVAARALRAVMMFDDYDIVANKYLLIVTLLVFFSQFWPLFGIITLQYHDYSVPILNFIVPLRRVVLLLVIVVQYFLLRGNQWAEVRRAILKGSIHGGILTVTWMIFEHILYISFHIPLNKIVFAEWFGLDPGHTFLNVVQLSDGYVLRATGFSWSPGLVGPPLLMIAILYLLLPDDIIGEKSIFTGLLLLSGPVLSLSRTAIFGTMVFLLFTVAILSITKLTSPNNSLLSDIYSRKVIYRIKIVVFIACIGLIGSVLYITSTDYVLIGSLGGFVLKAIYNPAPGVIRHVGYILYLPSILTYDIYGALFGYGVYTTGAGVELAASGLPGIERAMEVYQGTWRVEPQIVSILIAGGIPGSLSFLYAYFKTISQNFRTQISLGSSIQEVKVAIFCSTFLSTTFVLGLGYGVGGTFFLVVLILVILLTWGHR